MSTNYLTQTMAIWVQMLKDNEALIDLIGETTRVHRHALPRAPSGNRTFSKAELAAFRPFCLASRDDHEFRADSGGAGWQMSQYGRLSALIEWPVTAEQALLDPGVLYDAADLLLDGIISDLNDMNGQPSRLNMKKIKYEGPGRTPPEDRGSEGDYMRAMVYVDWGFE